MALKSNRLWLVSWAFKLIPTSRGDKLKSRLLRWAGAEVGERCEIMSSVKIFGNFTLRIGDHCFLGHEALLMGPSGSSITLDDNSKLGSRTVLVTGTHRFSADGECIQKEGEHADIHISRGAAVSTGSIILPGMTVDRMAHVAAGAVVTKSVPAFHRVAGVPARVTKDFTVGD